MEELKALLEKYLNENLELITLSAPRKGREELKARIRPVLLRDELKFQLEIFRGPKAFHENLPREEAVELIKRNTRHLAKRQLTWFRANDKIRWFDVTNYASPSLFYQDLESYSLGNSVRP